MHRSVLVHDIIKTNYVTQGYIPKNYPHHLISDKEMMDGFLKYDRISYLDSLLETNPLRSDLGTYSYDPETNKLKETATSEDDINPLSANGIHPYSIGISKTVDTDVCYVGDIVTYTITVTNAGDLGYDFIRDTVPSNLTIISESLVVTVNGVVLEKSSSTYDVTYSAQQFQFEPNSDTLFNSGDILELTYQCRADAWGFNVLNSVYSGGRTASVPITIKNRYIEKTSDKTDYTIGDTITYTIRVPDASQIGWNDIIDELPTNVLVNSGSAKVTLNGNQILSNWDTYALFYYANQIIFEPQSDTLFEENDVLEITYTGTARKWGFDITNTAYFADKEIGAVINIYAHSVHKTADELLYYVGDVVTYTITADEDTYELNNNDIWDDLPDELELISGSAVVKINGEVLESSGSTYFIYYNTHQLTFEPNTALFKQGDVLEITYQCNAVSPGVAVINTVHINQDSFNEQIEIDARYEFAIYSQDDKSLTFYCEGEIPNVGDTYNGKAVSNLYTDFADVSPSGEYNAPWQSLSKDAVYVTFDSSFIHAQLKYMGYWFYGFDASFSGFININTKNVTNMYRTFCNCKGLTNTSGMSSWDTSNCTDMGEMFEGCSALEDISDLNSWKVNKVTNMFSMFAQCTSIKEINLSKWDTSEVHNVNTMFTNCRSTTYINIEKWNCGNVTDCTSFATNCNNLEWINFGADVVIFRDNPEALVSQKDWYDSPTQGNVVSDNYLIGIETYGTYYTYTDISDKQAFAMYSADDNSLSFFYDGVPTKGSKYNNKTVTNVYTKFETQNWPINGSASWDNIKLDVKSVIIDNSFSSVKPVSLSIWFEGFHNAETFSGLENINTSEVTALSSTFAECYLLDNIDGLSNWDTSNVTTLYAMFRHCSITNVDALSNWNISKVTNIDAIFQSCDTITNLDGFSKWDVSNVTMLGYMCSGCDSLENIEGVKNWNTSKVSTLNNTFNGCKSLESIDPLSSWNISSVTNLGSTFMDCRTLTNVDAITNWNTSKVTSMHYTFCECSSLTTMDISGWDTSKVTSCSNFATTCTSLDWIKIGSNFSLFQNSSDALVSQKTWYDTDINGNIVSDNYMIGISGAGQYWTHTTIIESAFAVYSDDDGSFTFYYDKTPKVGDTYNGKKVDILYDNVDEEDTSSSAPWHDIHEYVNSVSFDSTFSTVQITICAHWFEDFTNCNSINLTNLDSSNVANFSYMFANCSKVPSLDVSMLSTSSATNMSYMFYKCTGLTSLDVSTFTASKVTTMESMFNECYNLISINVDGLSTSSATNLKQMFYACENITTLDISSFNTSKVTTSNCEGFLIGCTCLDWIKISDNFDLFTKYSSRITSFKYWYDSDENGNTISENYMIGVSGAGQYWTHTTTVDKTTLRIRKIWLEDEESDRPSSVTVHIFANGVETESKTITASDNWRYYADVPKYDDDYNRIKYTVTEDPLTNYKTVIDKFSIINTLVPSKDEPQTPEKIVTCGENKLVEVGEILTYRISYYNNYNEENTIIITDTLDEGVTFAYCSENGEYDEFTRTVTWKFTADAFEGGYVQLDVKVNKTAKVKAYIENTATVQIGNDTPVSSNTITNKLNDDSPKSPKKTLNSENEEINVGDELEYTISYYNHKNEATTITITETLGPALEFVSSDRSATITKNSDGTTTVKWSFTEQPFTSGTVTYKVVVTWYALYDLAITNQASIQIDSEDPVDTNTQTNTVEEPISPDYMRYVFHSGFYMDYYVEPMLRQFTTLDTEKMSEEEYTVLASMWHIGRFIADLFSDYLKGVENGTVERTIEKIYPDWVYSYMLGAAVCQKSPVLDRHDLFVLIDEDEDAKNYEDVFTIHNAAECYKISDRWLKKRTADVRPATCFGEMHVIKSLRLYHSTD